MSEIIHESVVTDSIGKVDSWGFGSRSSIISWPTLPGSPTHTSTTTCGGVVYPVIQGCERQDDRVWAYAPDVSWGGLNVRFVHADGRIFRPDYLDGRRVIVEQV